MTIEQRPSLSIALPKSYLFTSESVTEGHPDKMCDQISDAILDAIISKEIELEREGYIAPSGQPADVSRMRCACETLATTGLVAVATGVVTVVVGSLPFLGLIVPNLVSLSMGDNLRTNLPWVCLAGISLVTVTDLLARTIISPFEMPVSVILGVLGAFVFIALVLRQAKKGAVL